MAIPYAQINSQLTNRKVSSGSATPTSRSYNVEEDARNTILRLPSTQKRIADSRVEVVQPKEQTFAQKALQTAGNLYQSVFSNNEKMLEISEDDILKRMNTFQQNGKETKGLFNTLQLVQRARDKDASLVRKYATGLLLRGGRAGVQLQTGTAGFAASIADFFTQTIEQNNLQREKMLQSQYDRTGNEIYLQQLEATKIQEGEELPTRKISNALKKYADDYNLDNANFSEKVIEGAGSMIGFAMMAVLSRGGTLPYFAESFIESASTYEDQRNKGKSIEEATKRSNVSLIANLIYNKFLNIFDIDAKDMSIIKEGLLGALTEGAQEGGQQIISNLTTDRPWDEGVLEAAGIGATLGGVTVIGLNGGQQIEIDENNKTVTVTNESDPNLKIKEGETIGEYQERVQKAKGLPLLAEYDKAIQNNDTARAEEIARQIVSDEKYADYKTTFESRVGDKAPATATPTENTGESATSTEIASNKKIEPTETGTNEEPLKREKISVADNYEGATTAYAVVRPDGTGAISVVLKPEAQGKGLGSEIVAELEKLLAEKGVTKVELSAFDESVGFWEKQGYESVGEKTGVNQKMVKSLESEKTDIRDLNRPFNEENTQKVIEETTSGERENYRLDTQENIKKYSQGFGEAKPTDTVVIYRAGRGQISNGNYVTTSRERANTVYLKERPGSQLLQKEVLVSDLVAGNGLKSEFVYAPKSEISKKAATTPGKKTAKQAKTVTKQKERKTTKKKPTPKQESERIRRIRDYIDKKQTKFRQNPAEEVIIDEKGKVTSKFLEHRDVKGKKTAGYQFLFDLSKSTALGLKQAEKQIIQDVLVKNFAGQKQINMEDFRRAVIGQLMPLDAIISDTYADYGSDNIGMYDAENKTYILNSPFEHGQTGHFSSDFKRKYLTKEDLEIKEIPAQEGNPRAKWAVIQTGVQLTEENIEENVLTVATSKSNAQKWIDNKTEFEQFSVPVKVGLFSHFRSFDVDNISHIAEVQSDAFQHLERIDDTKRLRDLIQTGEEQLADREQIVLRAQRLVETATAANEEDRIERYSRHLKEAKEDVKYTKNLLEDRREELKKIVMSQEQTRFLDYKNIWQERTVREIITTKAREGFDVLRFPTPRTVSVVEGFVGGEENAMPYEILIAEDEERLTFGDTIDYGGEPMTVVSDDSYQIVVAPTDKVSSFMDSEFREEDANNRLEDVEYSFNQLQEEWGEIKTPEQAQFVLDSVPALDKLAKWTNKKEALRYATVTTQQSAERVAEIKAYKKPTAQELKGIPKAVIESAKGNQWGYSLGEKEYVLNEIASKEDGEYEFDDVSDDILNYMLENYEPDYEGMWEEAFFEEVGNDTRVWVVDGHTETLGQPDEYDQSKSAEDFDITEFDGEQRTVLEFYRKQVIPYIEKLRKGNIKLITDDNGYEWYETKLTPEDKAPPTAYRIKEDLQSVGIEITDEQEQEILDLNKKIFGDTNVKIVSQILANNSALGSYSEQMIKILDKQGDAKDTFLHEAVHKYLDAFTTKDEYVKILDQAQQQYGIDDLYQVEEKVAENFIEYAKKKKVGHRTVFDKIIDRIQAFFKNRSAIDKLYTDIISGQAKIKAEQKIRASKVAVSIEQNLNEQFKNLAGYETINIKDQARRAAELIASDLDRVRQIVAGKQQLPDGLRAGMLIKAVEDYATETNDIELLQSLATSPLVAETSVHAQELRLLAERDKSSVLSVMQDLASERAKIVEKRYKTSANKAIKQEVEKIKKEVKAPNKYSWNDFIKSIEC